MTQVRERYWVSRLRRLVRKAIKSCNECYRVQAKAYADPPPGKLPTDRTEGSDVFEAVGVDFARPLKYRKSKKQEGKAYLIVYACSLARALHLEVLTSLETTEFLGSLKRFIACRGRPRKIYSDNGGSGTFVAAAEWLRTVMKDQRVSKLLTREQIKWQFNLSRAPWWAANSNEWLGLLSSRFIKPSEKCFFIARRIERCDSRCGNGPQKSSTKLCRGRYTVSYFNSKFPFIQ